jgi:hypothetical protein
MTNFRSQVQMKGTDGLRANAGGTAEYKVNADGTVSLSVRSASLNHLLNGVCPIYILYVNATGDLWFVWGRDEQKRLQVDRPGWLKQETVTIRFARQLSTQALPKIRDRIIAEGRLSREMHDSLVKTTVRGAIGISVDTETLRAVTPERAEAVLAASGTTIVASGFPDEAIRLFNLLPVQLQHHPRFQLTCGYAHYTRGRFQAAAGCIAEALAHSGSLSAGDRVFLSRLKNACEHRLGVIDTEACLERAREIDRNATGAESLLTRVEAARRAVLNEADRDARTRLLDNLQAIVAEIVKAKDGEPWLRLHSKLCLLSLQGIDAAFKVNYELAAMVIRGTVGLHAGHDRISQAMRTWRQWLEETDQAVAEAVRIAHPILIGEALITRVNVYAVLLHYHRLEAASSRKQFAVEPGLAESVRSDAKRAIDIFQRADVLESEMRAKMALVDFEEICGDLLAAQTIATEVSQVAKAMGYSQLVAHAASIVGGKSLLARSLADSADHDLSYAQANDEEIRAIAEIAVSVYGLPRDRIPAMERELRAIRQALREQVYWCRHLNVLQADPEGHFRRLWETANPPEPNRACACTKHGYESRIENPDSGVVITAFKGAYCKGCPSRSPKVSRDEPGRPSAHS